MSSQVYGKQRRAKDSGGEISTATAPEKSKGMAKCRRSSTDRPLSETPKVANYGGCRSKGKTHAGEATAGCSSPMERGLHRLSVLLEVWRVPECWDEARDVQNSWDVFHIFVLISIASRAHRPKSRLVWKDDEASETEDRKRS